MYLQNNNNNIKHNDLQGINATNTGLMNNLRASLYTYIGTEYAWAVIARLMRHSHHKRLAPPFPVYFRHAYEREKLLGTGLCAITLIKHSLPSLQHIGSTFCAGHANVVPTFCARHAHIVPTLSAGHAHIVPTFCAGHAHIVTTFCAGHAHIMPTFCVGHAHTVPTFCAGYAHIVPTFCAVTMPRLSGHQPDTHRQSPRPSALVPRPSGQLQETPRQSATMQRPSAHLQEILKQSSTE
ncbi:hypothetical protein DPMN_010089 [Dreissena polymorpha]|uniref:Uncharacterized protein n=1 Tax=Dreissena polymorpha TaxID=45954 RepID=A0A9D4N1F4_DREPO|nr:hypothetical protein DPMN_010089 [Dreissena polymorpha]